MDETDGIDYECGHHIVLSLSSRYGNASFFSVLESPPSSLGETSEARLGPSFSEILLSPPLVLHSNLLSFSVQLGTLRYCLAQLIFLSMYTDTFFELIPFCLFYVFGCSSLATSFTLQPNPSLPLFLEYYPTPFLTDSLTSSRSC
jgi:hypothetical protein